MLMKKLYELDFDNDQMSLVNLFEFRHQIYGDILRSIWGHFWGW